MIYHYDALVLDARGGAINMKDYEIFSIASIALKRRVDGVFHLVANGVDKTFPAFAFQYRLGEAKAEEIKKLGPDWSNEPVFLFFGDGSIFNVIESKTEPRYYWEGEGVEAALFGRGKPKLLSA